MSSCNSGVDRQSAAPEALLRLLVEGQREQAMFVLDADGHVATWNAGAELMSGYTAEEALGRHISLFYPPEDVAAGEPERPLAAAAETGRVEDEGWRVRRDGSRFWAGVVTTALRDASGRLVGYGKVARDLSQRRFVQEALHEGPERFRLLVQSVKDYAIFMLDREGRVASWNEGAEAIKGYAAEQIVGESFRVFYPPEDLAWDKPATELEVAAREGRFEDEGWRVRRDGSRFWASVTIAAIRNGEGELLGFGKVTRDLTERRALQERALLDARRAAEAEAANRAKGEFLAALSHELRTPLNAIGGYVDLMALGIRGPVTEEQAADLARVRRSQQHLLGIINDLLNFSRIEAGQVRYSLETVQLAQVFDDVRPLVEPLALNKAIEIEWRICDEGAAAHADAPKVEQILINLLTNAVKFTDPGGGITVSARMDEGHAVLRVEDTGVGIEPERLADIFEPFVQVGRSLASAHEGTGLGLAISRDLARAMGGDLLVESSLAEGSTFTLLLPRAETAAEA
jgi:PAS domain S-box-containing protein